jgi:chondroitin AC lyase
MKDLQTVRDRLIATLLPPGGPQALSAGDARGIVAALDAAGRWPDIDYASKQRAHWDPGNHPRRALALARAYRAPGHALAGDKALRDATLKALRMWITEDLQCPNWWWNDIGVPEAVADAVLLMDADFPDDLRPGAAKILSRADRQDMTGQNTLWVCGVRLARGCIERDAQRVGAALARIAQEIKVTTGEGIQPDFSFHQHGALLYNGGYGRGFSIYGPQFARLAAGTRWAFSKEKIDILTGYLLDGQAWMIRGDRFDPSAIGREIVRPGHSAAPLARACEDLPAAGAGRAEEFRAFAARLKGEKGAPPLVGNRMFYRSDFMTHQRPGWYAGVRMFSKRMATAELVNGEGRKSHHLADAMTVVLRSGRELDVGPPVWDWKRLPGTTCEQGPLPDPVKQMGKTDFVGGASDGLTGAAAMHLLRGALDARLARFFLDDCIVALGAGITCTSDNPVVTSIEQRPAAGDAARGQAAGGRWTHHDGIGYVVMGTEGVTLKREAQTGSYREISEPGAAKAVTREMFSLWLDHGVRPAGAAYAWAAVPGASAEETARWAAAPPVRVLSNTADLQVVADTRASLTQAVFWKAGALDAPGLGRLTVDTPCVLVVQKVEGGVRLAAADPTQKAEAVTVSVGGQTVRIDLPRGPEAGASVVREVGSAKAEVGS